ncbi:MAG TPA: tRNA (adenosine(37)-N6)-threonylcarbamoyltransferase complex ATPase subunit type 1 TsaE [Alphaproteobacteria bacterium]|nr:tRNA (adenosine(37)-N6)-threonylcarbamoyltransferase complex ATPase subunit type 1 TsaE [Alphaproteobacteria bacterium]
MSEPSPKPKSPGNAPQAAARALELASLAATGRLARRLAPHLRAGDVIGLQGPLGIGKTAFARALIRALLGPAGAGEEVPSPTFTLVQTYAVPTEAGETPLYHFDLYRLARSEDAYELGIEEAFADGISLVEWPERLGSLLPRDRLELELSTGAKPTARHARLVGRGAWAKRLEGLVP